MDTRSPELKAMGKHSYRDTGVVVGIEGGDPSHAVVEAEFNNSGVIDGAVRMPARDLEGQGPLAIGSCIHADFVNEHDQHPVPREVTYLTDEEIDQKVSWL